MPPRNTELVTRPETSKSTRQTEEGATENAPTTTEEPMGNALWPALAFVGLLAIFIVIGFLQQ